VKIQMMVQPKKKNAIALSQANDRVTLQTPKINAELIQFALRKRKEMKLVIPKMVLDNVYVMYLLKIKDNHAIK